MSSSAPVYSSNRTYDNLSWAIPAQRQGVVHTTADKHDRGYLLESIAVPVVQVRARVEVAPILLQHALASMKVPSQHEVVVAADGAGEDRRLVGAQNREA